MNLKGKRLGCLLFIGLILLEVVLVSAFVVDGSSTCNPNGYTGGAGTWLIDPADNECWYLHSTPEFDGGYYNCVECHDGTQAHEW